MLNNNLSNVGFTDRQPSSSDNLRAQIAAAAFSVMPVFFLMVVLWKESTVVVLARHFLCGLLPPSILTTYTGSRESLWKKIMCNI